MSYFIDRNILVSIGITCFNAENTISRAIKSAIQQTWPKTEIIIVDDRSVDNTALVIQETIKHHNEIKYIKHKQNLGVASARNTIISQASGEYIVFFDDDDESFVDRVEKQVEEIEKLLKNKKFSGPVLCFASGFRQYENGYLMQLNAIGSTGVPLIGEEVAEYLLFNKRSKTSFYGTGTPACSLMMKTSDLRRLGGFDNKFRRVEDADLAIRAALCGAAFVGTKERLFMQFSTQGSHKSARINFKYEIQIIEKNATFLKERNRYFYSRLWTKIRLYNFQKKYFKFLILLLFFLALFPFAGFQHACISLPRRLLHEIRSQRPQR